MLWEKASRKVHGLKIFHSVHLALYHEYHHKRAIVFAKKAKESWTLKYQISQIGNEILNVDEVNNKLNIVGVVIAFLLDQTKPLHLPKSKEFSYNFVQFCTKPLHLWYEFPPSSWPKYSALQWIP